MISALLEHPTARAVMVEKHKLESPIQGSPTVSYALRPTLILDLDSIVMDMSSPESLGVVESVFRNLPARASIVNVEIFYSGENEMSHPALHVATLSLLRSLLLKGEKGISYFPCNSPTWAMCVQRAESRSCVSSSNHRIVCTRRPDAMNFGVDVCSNAASFLCEEKNELEIFSPVGLMMLFPGFKSLSHFPVILAVEYLMKKGLSMHPGCEGMCFTTEMAHLIHNLSSANSGGNKGSETAAVSILLMLQRIADCVGDLPFLCEASACRLFPGLMSMNDVERISTIGLANNAVSQHRCMHPSLLTLGPGALSPDDKRIASFVEAIRQGVVGPWVLSLMTSQVWRYHNGRSMLIEECIFEALHPLRQVICDLLAECLKRHDFILFASCSACGGQAPQVSMSVSTSSAGTPLWCCGMGNKLWPKRHVSLCVQALSEAVLRVSLPNGGIRVFRAAMIDDLYAAQLLHPAVILSLGIVVASQRLLENEWAALLSAFLAPTSSSIEPLFKMSTVGLEIAHNAFACAYTHISRLNELLNEALYPVPVLRSVGEGTATPGGVLPSCAWWNSCLMAAADEGISRQVAQAAYESAMLSHSTIYVFFRPMVAPQYPTYHRVLRSLM